MKRLFKVVSYLFLFILFSAITQIGGITLLLSLLISKKIKRNFNGKRLIIFLSSYLLFTFILVPNIAPIFGREKIKFGKPTNYLTVLLNRNYVKSELNTLLNTISQLAHYENKDIHYLDANFPFFDGFPLLPHLSHKDGKKLDLSLVYETPDGTISNKQKSFSGYGVFEGPKAGEPNQISKCKDVGYSQYDYTKYLTFGSINNDLHFSEKGTKLLVETILQFDNIEKIFIEPHLKQRLKLNHPKIRYHGCRAVRHDDHIHIQIK